MTIDNDLVLAESQAITANANTASKEVGAGALESKAAFLRLKAKVAGAGTGSIQLAIQGSDDNSTFVDLAVGAAVNAVDIAVGDEIKTPIPPNAYKYLRGRVGVTGTVSAGSGLVDITVG